MTCKAIESDPAGGAGVSGGVRSSARVEHPDDPRFLAPPGRDVADDVDRGPVRRRDQRADARGHRSVAIGYGNAGLTGGEAGTGDIVEAVRHMRTVQDEIRKLVNMSPDELASEAKELGAPLDLVIVVHKTGKLPVVNFAAGGVATPADAALMMQLGADGVFVGSGIFKSSNPEARAKAIVKAVTHYNDAKILAKVSQNLGEAMLGMSAKQLPPDQLLAGRGW